MAVRGTKPKPTHLKLVAGDPRQRGKKALAERAERERKLPDDLPMPPPELMDEAKVEWGRISTHLHKLGLLTEIDRGALAACCQAYGRWMRAERLLKVAADNDPVHLGLVIATTNGNLIQNPLVGTGNKAMSDYVRYCAEFGMTPSSRSRIDVQAPEEDDEFFD